MVSDQRVKMRMITPNCVCRE